MEKPNKLQRISKYIASAGICSRRKAEKLITDGAVKIDGKIINTLSLNVSTDNIVEVNGVVVKPLDKLRIWCYYKPQGLITSHYDPKGRDIVFDNLPGLPKVISIGRLDMNSEGLLILTNNGDFARKMELPKNKTKRVYKVRAYGNINSLQKFITKRSSNNSAMRIFVDGITYSLLEIKLIRRNKTNSWFKVVLEEGKNREIRKVFQHFNLTVNRLIRTRFGNWELGKLKPGEYIEVSILT